ncbi:Hypothetical_protein [Hexamita inflata]|uniref:Hypothetical_protein n=1 Tax=Hexamita inflata TaxID=28002 RepID=A0AA86PP33_9EUKA|nr:Hypothetical protein HINF_LOCUS29427 [Hexamita inflata]
MYLVQRTNAQLFINTDIIKKSVIDVQIDNYAVNIFVLFGLGVQQTVQDSQINITLNFKVFQGALICVKCDVYILNCSLVFVASGQQVSALLIEGYTYITISQSFIQYRISSLNSSGIVNVVNDIDVNISIIDCKLAGYNLINSGFSGYIAVSTIYNISINITRLYICVDNITVVGNSSNLIIFDIMQVIVQCDLCSNSNIVYGLCSESLINGQLLNGMQQCVYPFIYDGSCCKCAQGYVFEQNSCINIIQTIRDQSNQFADIIGNEITELQNELQNLDKYIMQNVTQFQDQMFNQQSVLANYIKQNISQLQQNFSQDISVLENRIISNATMLANNIKDNSNALEKFILQNFTFLDQNIVSNSTQLLNNIIINSTKLEKYIKENDTVLDWRIYYNISSLNVSLNNTKADVQQLKLNMSIMYNDLNQSISNVKTNLTKLLIDDQNLNQENIQNLQNIIIDLINQINCTNNAGYQYINKTCVLSNCLITGQERVNGICQCANANEIVRNGSCVCPESSNLVRSVCICPENSSFNGNICACNIIGQSIMDGKCVCPTGLSVLDGACQEVHIIIGDDGSKCIQGVLISVFDIQTQTHSVNSSNFSSGYVFNSSITIQNAFIAVSDNVYTTNVYPLFQNQKTFANIKIQVGSQTLNSGSFILSANTSIIINQMNIISRLNSQITVSALSQFNIISFSSTSAFITNLLVNLSFAPSNGNITLISNINGVFNISGYQVFGVYNSSLTVAMIGLNVNIATIAINQVSFKPSVYNVGNCSSYLFGTSNTIQSTFIINNIAITIGNSSTASLLGSISTTNSKCYIFGGIIAQMSNTSTLNVTNIIVDTYQQFSSIFVNKTGILLGFDNSNATIIFINKVCLQQNITSTSDQWYDSFGLIGYSVGNTTLKNTYVTFSIQGKFFISFGLIGSQFENSSFAEVINLKTSVKLNSTNALYLGLIFGIQAANNCSIKNSSVVGGNFVNGEDIGGFMGYQYSNTNVSITNSSISNTNITGSTGIGGIVGELRGFSLTLTNVTIQRVFLQGKGKNFGVVIGLSQCNQYFFTNSSSSSNYVKGTLQKDCAVLSNTWSIAGC